MSVRVKTREFQAISGQVNGIIVPTEYARGAIGRFIVTQLDGNLDGFSTGLYSSASVLPATNQSSSSSEQSLSSSSLMVSQSELARWSSYEIYAWSSVPAGQFVIRNNGEWQYYDNAASGPSSVVKELYLLIMPEGTGTKTFTYQLAAEEYQAQ